MGKNLKDIREIRMAEIRSEEAPDGQMVVEGYAVVFDQPTLIGTEDDGFYEVVDRHALDKADMSDTPLKYNHGDAKGILARVRNKSLTLTIDEKGLKIRAVLQPNVQDHVDVYNSIQSGLLDKMSFAFDVTDQEIDRSVIPFKRRIKSIGTLWDCSVVDIPAYDGTSIYARSKEIVGEHLRSLAPLDNGQPTLDNVDRLELERLKALIKGGLY